MNNQFFYNASIEQAILSAIIFEPEIFQYGAGKYLDSYLFSREITPASTEVLLTFKDSRISNMPIFK